MKKILTTLFFFLITMIGFNQDNMQLNGVWEIITKFPLSQNIKHIEQWQFTGDSVNYVLKYSKEVDDDEQELLVSFGTYTIKNDSLSLIQGAGKIVSNYTYSVDSDSTLVLTGDGVKMKMKKSTKKIYYKKVITEDGFYYVEK